MPVCFEPSALFFLAFAVLDLFRLFLLFFLLEGMVEVYHRPLVGNGGQAEIDALSAF